MLVWSLAGGAVTHLASFYAFDPALGGDVHVACGDVNGDGQADVIAGAGEGAGPQVRAFSIQPGGVVVEIASFLAYDPALTGGVRVAAGDVNGDGLVDIITGAGAGSGRMCARSVWPAASPRSRVSSPMPRFHGRGAGRERRCDGRRSGGNYYRHDARWGAVRVFQVDSTAVSEVTSFFPYFDAFRGPVRVAAADVDGDGLADIVRAPVLAAARMCRRSASAPQTLVNLASFYAYDPLRRTSPRSRTSILWTAMVCTPAA